MAKTLGEMTPEERDAAIKRAATAFQRELDQTAGAIGAALDAMSGADLAPTGPGSLAPDAQPYWGSRPCLFCTLRAIWDMGGRLSCGTPDHMLAAQRRLDAARVVAEWAATDLPSED